MGPEARRNAILRQQSVEVLKSDAGELLDFGTYSDGCPACGDPRVEVQYHVGSAIARDSDCEVKGRHLHCVSVCGRHWLTRCKDDPENGTRAPSPLEAFHAVLRAIAAQFPEGLIVTTEEMRAASGGAVFIDDVEGGKKLIFVPRP